MTPVRPHIAIAFTSSLKRKVFISTVAQKRFIKRSPCFLCSRLENAQQDLKLANASLLLRQPSVSLKVTAKFSKMRISTLLLPVTYMEIQSRKKKLIIFKIKMQ